MSETTKLLIVLPTLLLALWAMLVICYRKGRKP